MTISPLLVFALVCLAGGGSLLRVVEAIWLTIPWVGDKCIYEDIQANVVVIGDFLCIDRDNEVGLGPTVNIRVITSSVKKDHIYFHCSSYFILLSMKCKLSKTLDIVMISVTSSIGSIRGYGYILINSCMYAGYR